MIIQSKSVRSWMIIGGLLLAFALRAYTLFFVPLSLDEILTITRYVPLPLVEIFSTHHSNNQPLASATAHLFSSHADNLFMMRWPMLLIGMLVLPLVYQLGRLVYSPETGILALILMAVAPIHLAYSVVVRGYSGLILLVTMSLYFLLQAVQKRRWRDWTLFLAANLLVVFFHMFGAFAAAVQIGLVGLWLVWEFIQAWRHQRITDFFAQNRLLLWQLALVTIILLSVYPLLITSGTEAILSEGGHPAEFEAWRAGLSWSPVVEFINRVGPMSPFGIGAGLYLVLAATGLVFLWFSRRMWAVGIAIWLALPFPAIYVAMQLLGLSFYAYVRFLLYLLPAYFVLISIGILAVGRLVSLATRKWPKGIGVTLKWVGIAGLLVLLFVSVNWYLLRATSVNWLGIADTLSAQLGPQDVVICEEYQRGFDVPDRAKPYCIWMLDFYIDDLVEYSSRFQSSTDFVVQYDFLQQHRASLVEPGGVWLIIWKKLVYNPGHLITSERPVTMPLVDESEFEPYQAFRFGSAFLVYVNSESSVLANLRQATLMLLELQPNPADKARYLRSLAELEAVQGHKSRARGFAQQSRDMVNLAGNIYPDSFLAGTRSQIDRIPEGSGPLEAAQPANYWVDPSLCLNAYQFSLTQTGDGILTLVWQIFNFIDRDYSFFIELYNKNDQPIGRVPFDPFNRQYPTAWWWPGQQLVEQHTFTIPPDLPEESFQVRFGGIDRNTGNTQFMVPLFSLSPNSGAEYPRWTVVPGKAEASPCPARGGP